ncbi:transmembrane protein 164-like isoform X2 [Clytia hemisphaerica]
MAGLESIRNFLKMSYEGVDFQLAGNGGFDCYDYLTIQSRVTDTCVFVMLVFILIFPKIIRSLTLPKEWEIAKFCQKPTAQRICGFRKFLLIALSIILGIELGYKISERSWIFLLNPCHVITILQIYLLSAEPGRMCTAVFRLHIHLLFGAFLAFVFPVLNTRVRHGEQMIYYLQHFMITLVVPPYLIHTGGAYRCEPLRDFNWVLLAVVVWFLYVFHFTSHEYVHIGEPQQHVMSCCLRSFCREKLSMVRNVPSDCAHPHLR